MRVRAQVPRGAGEGSVSADSEPTVGSASKYVSGHGTPNLDPTDQAPSMTPAATQLVR